MFSVEGKFYQFMDLFVDCILLSLLWLISSVPIFTLGASTAALYHTVEKVLNRQEGHMWQEFWKVFKRDFKQATLLLFTGVLILAIVGMGCVSACAYLLPEHKWHIPGIIFVVYAVLVAMWSQYWFPYVSKFEDTVPTILRNTMSMALRDFKWSIALLVILVAAVILWRYVPILFLFLPVGYMLIETRIIEGIFSKYI